MPRARFDRLLYVKMKASRADFHFQALDTELGKWAAKPYAVTKQLQFEKSLYAIRIDVSLTPEIIPMLLGNFICCLRASLDHLAWRLAHIPPVRKFTARELKQIQFPIFVCRNTYKDRRKLFPPAVADIFDTLQPYLRGNAYRDDPLWQLNELWTMDKHRSIPISPYSVNLGFAINNWEQFINPGPFPSLFLHHHIDVELPL